MARGPSKATCELILFAKLLLAEVNPQTLRQLHYAIFSRAQIGYQNTQSDYRRLSRATTLARRAYRQWELDAENCDYAASRARLARIRPGLSEVPPEFAIDPEWMVDETRQAETPSVWENAREYIEVVGRDYRRDNWQDQPYHCEVWSEKQTILGSIRPVLDELGVTARVLHGFGSTGQEQEIGELFSQIANGGRLIQVFFLGDFDPSGVVIEEEFHRRTQKAAGVEFDLERLAIHESDIKSFRLPPQRIKNSDSRARSFRKKYGRHAHTVELDALPADELRRRVKDAIENLIDSEPWSRQLKVQAAELTCIAEFAAKMKNLPQLSGGGQGTTA